MQIEEGVVTPSKICIIPTSGLLSMLHSDWLSYYAICYSPLVVKNADFLAAKKG